MTLGFVVKLPIGAVLLLLLASCGEVERPPANADEKPRAVLRYFDVKPLVGRISFIEDETDVKGPMDPRLIEATARKLIGEPADVEVRNAILIVKAPPDAIEHVRSWVDAVTPIADGLASKYGLDKR